MYRGSSLGSELTAVQLKTLERIINKRHVSRFQSGFRTSRSTTENTDRMINQRHVSRFQSEFTTDRSSTEYTCENN